MSAEQLARPEDSFKILASERPDLPGAGFKVFHATASSNLTVSTTATAVPGMSITLDVTSADAAVLLLASVSVGIGADATNPSNLTHVDIVRSGTSFRTGGLSLFDMVRSLFSTGTPNLVETGLSVGSYTWSVQARKAFSTGSSQVQQGSRFTALLFDR